MLTFACFKLQIWDNYGRMLFASSVYDYPITSLSWSPNGDLFAVGAFNSIRLCDSSGVCILIWLQKDANKFLIH